MRGGALTPAREAPSTEVLSMSTDELLPDNAGKAARMLHALVGMPMAVARIHVTRLTPDEVNRVADLDGKNEPRRDRIVLDILHKASERGDK